MSDETKKKISATKLKDKKLCKAVYCVELNKIFESVRKAAEETGTQETSISKCLSGHLKTAGGYH